MQSTAESPIAELEVPTQRREGVLEQILRQLNDIASMQRDLSDRMSHMEGTMGQIVQRQNSIEQSQRDLMQSQLDLSDRMSRMEGSADQQSRQINSIDTRLTNLEARFFTALCWIVGIQITTLLTLGTLILFKFGD